MKANNTLNARPLLRAFYVVLVTCTALLAMPKRADAQVYVSQFITGIVSEYDEKTGDVINAGFITGLAGPNVIIRSGDTLFIAEVFNPDPNGVGGVVGKYDAKTGSAISQSFITGTDFVPVGLALSGDTLFVASAGVGTIEGTIGKYDAKTGKAIDTSFITGLPAGPVGEVIFGLGLSGDNLFVTNNQDNALIEFNAKTGKAIGSPVDVATPYGIGFYGGKIFVASEESGTIAEYTRTGELINANFITGLGQPFQIAIVGDTLFVADGSAATVGKYDAKTGAAINAAFISGLFTEPVGIAVKAQTK
jgi:hypothetical protein